MAGAKRGAIYDLETGKVYSVNHGALELLRACEKNEIENFMDIKDPENKDYVQFLDQLSQKGLGSFAYEKWAQVRTAAELEPAVLDFLWLEITSLCNNRCLHCYGTCGPKVHQSPVTHERWLSLITEARQAGATAIQLIGGEPLLYPKWQELIIKAKEEDFEFIEIFTNATCLKDSDIEFIKQQGVHVATTIYGDQAESHDAVTQNPGSFVKTLGNIEKLLAKQIPLRIASIIMKTNEDQVEPIMKLCEKLGVEVTPPDVIRPTGRGENQALLPNTYKKPSIKPPFHADEESFYLAQKQHPCLASKIAITAEGEVIPCIFARSQICGNIVKAPLAEVLSGKALTKCWYTTKDQVEKCRDCEYRYACADCRPLAQGSDAAKNWLASPTECHYNPYLGQWDKTEVKTNQSNS